MTEKKHEQPESDAENPSLTDAELTDAELTDAELEQVAGGGGSFCQRHNDYKPCSYQAPHDYI